jgi:hypothetical protein
MIIPIPTHLNRKSMSTPIGSHPLAHQATVLILLAPVSTFHALACPCPRRSHVITSVTLPVSHLNPCRAVLLPQSLYGRGFYTVPICDQCQQRKAARAKAAAGQTQVLDKITASAQLGTFWLESYSETLSVESEVLLRGVVWNLAGGEMARWGRERERWKRLERRERGWEMMFMTSTSIAVIAAHT